MSRHFLWFDETILPLNLSTRIVLSCTLHCLMWASDDSPAGGLSCVSAAFPSHGAEVKAQLTSYVQQHSTGCQLFFPAASHAETGPWCWEASLWIPTTRNNTISIFEQPQSVRSWNLIQRENLWENALLLRWSCCYQTISDPQLFKVILVSKGKICQEAQC